MSLQAIVEGHVVRIAGWRRMFRAVMLSAIALCAQTGDWALAEALPPGAQVDVKRFSGGGLVRGEVASVSSDGVVVQRKSDTVTVDRADVQRLRLRSQEKSTAGRVTGMAILGGLAVPAAMVGDGGGAERAAVIPVSAGLGYLIGWAFESRKSITLYEAPKP
ncbi:MAG: hypothetical protein GC160_12105 [Acidobacteria bacterium]|nr:hypothetical protein [Acidobacteriota bacterium]